MHSYTEDSLTSLQHLKTFALGCATVYSFSTVATDLHRDQLGIFTCCEAFRG